MTPTPLKWYQYISKFTPASCRYYPTCSEYAKWLYEFDNPVYATLKSAKRIASCNQLFPGGIDYPKIALKKYNPITLHNCLFRKDLPHKPLKFKPFKSKLRIIYWLIPQNNNLLILKDFNETATYLPTGYAPAFTPK